MTDHEKSRVRAHREELKGLREEHRRVTGVLRDLETLARRTGFAPTTEAWVELRCAFVETALVLVDHAAREEVVLQRILEGFALDRRLATMRDEHADHLTRLRKLNAALALAAEPPPTLAEEITFFAAQTHQELEEEKVALYVPARTHLDGGERRPITCGDVMRKPARWISQTDTARTAARTMRDANIGFLVICDGSARVVGTLTDRDVVTRVLAADANSGTPVSAIMSSEVVCCHPTDELAFAEEAMMQNQKARIVIVDEARHALGVISLEDIALREDDPRVADVLRQVHARAIRSHVPPHAGR
jgi:CBS domain-containing protein